MLEYSGISESCDLSVLDDYKGLFLCVCTEVCVCVWGANAITIPGASFSSISPQNYCIC